MHKFIPEEEDTYWLSLIAVRGENASFNIVRFEKITGQKFQNNIQVLVCVKVKFHAQYGLQLDLLDVIRIILWGFWRDRGRKL